MFYTKVLPDDMKSRLDANFYRPEYLEIERKLEKLGSTSLDTLCSGVECGPFGGNAIADDLYAENGIAFIRPVNISSQVFDESSLVKVPETVLIERNLKIYDGINLYFGRVGDPCVAIIDRKTSISPNIIIAKTDYRLANPYYLYAFSSCKFGIKQILRQLKTVAQPTTSTEAVRSLSVYKANSITQKYIGNKVRQAEQLRAWAKITEASVRDFHVQFIPEQENLNFNKKTRLLSTNKMTERLDAHFYPGVVEEDLKLHPNFFKSLESLTTDVYNGQTQPAAKDQYCLQITVTHLSASFVKGQPREVECPTKNNKFVKPHDILMCNAAHNKVYIGRELTYVHTNERLLPSTEVMTIRINREMVPASYVRTYLETKLGYVKIQSTIRGITAHSYPDDVKLLDIYIPDIPSDQKEAWFNQDTRLICAGNATESAYYLTTAAKILVEALIEGQLTEEQLIQAQQALEDGDNTRDKAILNKLSSEGYAVEGATPLFSDVDELYRLLASATTADSED